MPINQINVIKNPNIPLKSFKIKRINNEVTAQINGIWSQEDEALILEIAQSLVVNRGFTQAEINAIHTQAFSIPDRVQTHLTFVENMETDLTDNTNKK